jgi:hypothetical protein
MPHGGHFAALEEPELLVNDIREFFRPLRNAAKSTTTPGERSSRRRAVGAVSRD